MPTEKDLNSIAGKLETIAAFEEEIDIDFIFDDFPNLVKECSEGSERIKKIVIDLKNFAHPGEDKQKLADINRNLDSTLNVVRNEIKYKASVKKDYGDLPEVLCHPQQLNQVFMNLFVNAAQAIEKDGEIKVQTRAANGFVEIRISDTGVGIPKENTKKIFDPFFTTKDVGKGTGLGLNVSYNIIKEHNGTIEVDSTVGQGTIFTVRIPVQ
jgi:signal transduction histidine kinase